jgi:hypothetical protein
MKACTYCKQIKTEDNFYLIKQGKALYSKCKSCCVIVNKETQKKRDKDKKHEYNQEYYKKNKHDLSLKNKEKKNAYREQYYAKNKALIFEKEKIRYHNDINFRLSKIYRNRFNAYIKGERNALKYLECSIDCLKTYLEKQFSNHMSWDNKGSYWEIDHVIPVSKFNLANNEHVKVCFHWCNLRPIPETENKAKFNKIDYVALNNHMTYCSVYAKQNDLPFKNILDFYIQNIQSSY